MDAATRRGCVEALRQLETDLMRLRVALEALPAAPSAAELFGAIALADRVWHGADRLTSDHHGDALPWAVDDLEQRLAALGA